MKSSYSEQAKELTALESVEQITNLTDASDTPVIPKMIASSAIYMPENEPIVGTNVEYVDFNKDHSYLFTKSV